MGCCCSCFTKKNQEQDEDLEPLITNDHNEECHEGIQNYDILEEFANNLITNEIYEITPQEYKQRSKIYEMRLNQIEFEMPEQSFLLNDIPNPEVVLASKAIDSDDAKLIRNFVKEAMKYFKIEHDEGIIVHFPP